MGLGRPEAKEEAVDGANHPATEVGPQQNRLVGRCGRAPLGEEAWQVEGRNCGGYRKSGR